MPSPARSPAPRRLAAARAERWALAGLVGASLALYVLTGPGRIDMVDGQWRYEVARSLVDEGRPVVRDPALAPSSLPGRDGLLYSAYGPGGSLVGVPLVWAGGVLAGEPFGELRRFLFSQVSPIAGALLVGVVFAFYRRMGVGRRRAAGWALVGGFATLVWPLAVSTFDQAQHALLATSALCLAFLSARRRSPALALAGGGVGGLLLTYQEIFVVLLPPLAIACLAEPGDPDPAAGRRRAALFLAGTLAGLALFVAFNVWRFGAPLYSGKLVASGGHPAAVGHLGIGLWGLLLSQGKSVFLYSPVVILALLGLRALWRRHRRLAQAVLTLTAVHLVLVASLSFWAGDWCWGPRYFVVVLPALGLTLPLLRDERLPRALVATLVAAGLGVQLLAVSLDHQRFFFERELPPFFWDDDPGLYARESQLVSRPFEIAAVVRQGVPAEADRFSPAPHPHLLTYCIFGPAELFQNAAWVRRFQVFWLPRPWPLWMPFVDRQRYRLPLEPGPAAAAGLLLLAAGLAALRRGLADPEGAPPTEPPDQARRRAST